MDENARKLLNERLDQFVSRAKKSSEEEKIIDCTSVVSQLSQVDVNAAYQSVSRKIMLKSFSWKRRMLNWAAVLFLPFFLISVWSISKNFDYQKKLKFSSTIQKMSCPPGVRSHLTLPDGTEVWMNSGSKISYPIPFNTRHREVQLSGEAFLDVASLKNSDFSIRSQNVQIKVLGTQFDFKSFADDDHIQVSLLRGKIDLQIAGNSKVHKHAVMVPGDHLDYNKETGQTQLKQTNLENYVGWRKGRLVFDNTPLSEVARMLSRWYGVKVKIRDESITDYKYTTTFENNSIQDVVELMRLTSSVEVNYNPPGTDQVTGKTVPAEIIFSKANH